MEKRILELAAESSCRADYLSEVLRAPVTAVQTELDRLADAGKLVKQTITIYRTNEENQAERNSQSLERKIRQQVFSVLHNAKNRAPN